MAINRRMEMQVRKPKLNFRSSFLRVKSVGLSNFGGEVIEATLLEMFKLDWAELREYISGSKSSLAVDWMYRLVQHLGKSMGVFQLPLDQTSTD